MSVNIRRCPNSEIRASEKRDYGVTDLIIEGYFAVFDTEIEIDKRWYESIKRGAFRESLKNNDVCCLINHETGRVLARMSNGTLELEETTKGLWGRAVLNSRDPEAVSVYEKIKRQDIKGCSFGFTYKENGIVVEETERGTVDTLLNVDLLEVSVTPFPAYPQTDISARAKYAGRNKKQEFNKRIEDIKKKIAERN